MSNASDPMHYIGCNHMDRDWWSLRGFGQCHAHRHHGYHHHLHRDHCARPSDPHHHHHDEDHATPITHRYPATTWISHWLSKPTVWTVSMAATATTKGSNLKPSTHCVQERDGCLEAIKVAIWECLEMRLILLCCIISGGANRINPWQTTTSRLRVGSAQTTPWTDCQ